MSGKDDEKASRKSNSGRLKKDRKSSRKSGASSNLTNTATDDPDEKFIDDLSALKVSKKSSSNAKDAKEKSSSAGDDNKEEKTKAADEKSTRPPPPTTQNSSASIGRTNSGVSDDKNQSSGRAPAFDKTIINANGVSYAALSVVGNGSFGVVIQAQQVDTNEVVAIKKVLQDKRFKNRELQIMRLLNHPNVVMLKNSFYTTGAKQNEDVYLNLVLEFVPETVYRVGRQYIKQRQHMPILYVKCYIYQLLKALEYIHALGICHRDIKPQNLLLNTKTSVLKLCDFGSAKILVKGEPNVAYICSRYYRAPELIFGATDYTTAIDVWSAGCVLAELLLGAPMFPGDSGMDQLVEIIKVLGTPSKEQIQAMNPNYTEFKFPQIKAHPWNRVFRSKTEEGAIDMCAKLLVYEPTVRLDAKTACDHPFYDALKDPSCVLPNGKKLPALDGIAHTLED